MRLVTLCLIALLQTACASLLEPYRLGNARDPSNSCLNKTFNECGMYSYAREMGEKHKEQWKKWDKEYVSDDVILLEVKDANGKTIATGQAR